MKYEHCSAPWHAKVFLNGGQPRHVFADCSKFHQEEVARCSTDMHW